MFVEVQYRSMSSSRCFPRSDHFLKMDSPDHSGGSKWQISGSGRRGAVDGRCRVGRGWGAGGTWVLVWMDAGQEVAEVLDTARYSALRVVIGDRKASRLVAFLRTDSFQDGGLKLCTQGGEYVCQAQRG